MVELGIYRHFKGNEYEVIGVVRDKEDNTNYVLYRQLYGSGGYWIRPEEMFIGYKEVGGFKIKRFERVSNIINTDLSQLVFKDLDITHSETKVHYRLIENHTDYYIAESII